MIPILLDGPTLEPVSLSEAKAWLKVDASDEDDLIRALTVAARLMVEAEIGEVLIGQTWRLIGDVWPADELIPVRVGRLLGVSGARIYSAQGVATPIAPSTIALYPERDPPAIAPAERPAPGRPRSGIEIDVRLGYGEAASAVPETLRLAIKRLTALWYERRGEVDEDSVALPPQIRALLKPYRRLRI